MPSNVVHYYFADKVYEGLNREIKELIDRDRGAYNVGAQGPDILFYLKFEDKSIKELGGRLHQSFNAADVFLHSGNLIKENKPEAFASFILGQLCHYALDSNLHPYVYHREKDLPAYYRKPYHKYIHVVFESGLDYICVRDYIKANTVFYRGYKNLRIKKTSRREIGEYYSGVINSLLGVKLLPEKADMSIRLMKLFLWITDDITGVKRFALRILEKLAGLPVSLSAFCRPRRERKEEDWLNHNRTAFPQYRNRPGTVNYTVEETAESAYKDAVKLIENFYAFINGGELDKNLYIRNYAGDLPGD